MLNVVAIMGRLVADPELRTTTNGANVCTFRIACERSYTPKGQQRQADFVDIVAWGKTAEFICKFFQRGSMIAIDGSLQTRNYQDKQGNKRTAVEVLANNISFAGAKAADKPAARDFDQQTQTYTHEAKTAQSAPQPAYTHGSMDDFSVISDTDDLPF
uniref:Single-stranded DNA-binding protein n=1 Tax=Siphoviridae sp. ctXPH7 TaxID=2826367 RepID=A0A8S5LYI5_9CAUD|nr:MAG TPA: Single strand binding protein [Siphoviridae sp. ctXPH7]